MSITDIINNDFENIITPQNWMTKNNSLLNFKKYQVSISLTSSQVEDLTSPFLLSILKNEINSNIVKSITEELLSTQNIEFLDLTFDSSINVTSNFTTYLDKLITFISKNEFDNILSGPRICSILQDSSSFTSSVNVTTEMYKHHGKLLNRYEIYNNPFLKYNDGRLCLFNKIEYNIGQIKAHVMKNLNSQIIVEFEVDFIVRDSKLLIVIDNDSSEHSIFEYKSFLRDNKINKIINE